MIRRVDVRELRTMLTSETPPILIDVREAEEYALARIAGFTLMPMMEIPVRIGEIQPEPGQEVVLLCHHGVRSLKAAYYLAQTGLENVVSVDGGIDAWSALIDPQVPRY
ncbi:MAG: rhodanese-like domain-containing protein [Fimbriiglobus sp.]